MPYFCSSPFNSLWVNVDGDVKTCCAGSYPLGNLFKDSIEEILQGAALKKIQENIKNGITPDYCSGCVRSEQLIGSSQRSYYEQFKDTDSFELKSVDIRWNETCNLSCVYCDEHFSSKWAKKKPIPVRVQKPYHGNLMAFLIKNAPNMEAIMLAGGEPLMHKEMLPFIRALASDTKIDVMTNLGVDFTNYPFAQELIKRNSYFNVSIENVGASCEYVRNEIVWNTLVSNLNKIGKARVTFLSLYNIFSCTKLFDLITFAQQHNIKITWQNLSWPTHLSVFNFSNKIKELAIAEIDKCKSLQPAKPFDHATNTFLYETKESLIKSLNNKNPVDKNFREYIIQFEEKYNGSKHKFADLWPELQGVLNG